MMGDMGSACSRHRMPGRPAGGRIPGTATAPVAGRPRRGRAARSALLGLLAAFPAGAAAQTLVETNPLESFIVTQGNISMNGSISDATESSAATASLETMVSGEFAQIRKWERRYAEYLSGVEGYASTIKACTTMWEDAAGILVLLARLGHAIGTNPQGIVATMSMGDMYLETVTEFLSLYGMLEGAVARGGTGNMLDGAQRTSLLWSLEDRLGAFSRRLRRLYLSVKCYGLNDVWNGATAGMLDRDNGELARQALSTWQRFAGISAR